MAFLSKAGVERLWSHVISRLNNKVDKVDGKGLSTNDFTNEEKDKLNKVISYNVQELTESEQEQARTNIGAVSEADLNDLAEDVASRVETKSVQFIDGTEVVPNMISYTGSATIAEIVSWLRNTVKYNVEINRKVMHQDDSMTTRRNVSFEIIQINNEEYNAIVYFGDDIAPVIFDSVNNTITIDPDWVKPVEFVQSDWNQTDETAMDFIKNKPDEEDALAILSEMNFVNPVMASDGSVFTDNNGALYTI